MAVASLEYAVIAFPGNHFKGEILPEIKQLVDHGIVRVLDLVVVLKNADGDVEAVEVSALPPESQSAFADIPHTVSGLLNEQNIEEIAAALPADCSAAVLVWENLWSSRFAEAVMNADGILVVNEKIPAPDVKAALEYAESNGFI